MDCFLKICRRQGIALLYAVLFIGVIMTLVLLTQNIVLKLIVSGRTERDGVYAYYAADAGVECIRYMDSYYYGRMMGDPGPTAGYLRHYTSPAYCYRESALISESAASPYGALLLIPSPRSTADIILNKNKRCAVIKMRIVPIGIAANMQDIFGSSICLNGTMGTILSRIQTNSPPVLRILLRRQ